MYFPHCGKFHKFLTTLWKLSLSLPQHYLNYLTVTLSIVDHLEHFFQISEIEPTYLRKTSTNPFAMCQIFSASMLAALTQYSISDTACNAELLAKSNMAVKGAKIGQQCLEWGLYFSVLNYLLIFKSFIN